LGYCFERARFQPCRKWLKIKRRALQAAEKLAHSPKRQRFVTGHDFSRAATAAKSTRALAPAKLPIAQQSNSGLFPQPV
jgi:hypothetical protein